jgi:triosephosphate isomerase
LLLFVCIATFDKFCVHIYILDSAKKRLSQNSSIYIAMIASLTKRLFSSTRLSAARVPVVGGNWKCNAGNGTTMDSVQQLVSDLNQCVPTGKVEIFAAAPAIYLPYLVSNLDKRYNTCSQNVWKEVSGAYTGEISADMLVDLGVQWTLVGHSERRDIFGEKDDLLQAKITRAQEVGMTVVACCGEHKEDREAGTTMDVLIPQLQAIVDGTTDWSKMVVAYEPVWAIGTGLTATPEQAQDTHANIREWFAGAVSAEVADGLRIQYGGSANADNAAQLGAMADIDGFLVGGAALKADGFSTIFNAIAK